MQQELAVLRAAHAATSAELESARDDLQRSRDEDEQLLNELRQQIRKVRAERSKAQQQVESLERALAHAEHRQKFAESHLDTLETKLDEERTRHDDNMQVTRTRLVHMQEEQRALLTQQTELTTSLGTLENRLLETTPTDSKPNYSLLQLLLMSGVLLVAGILFGLLSMQRLQNNNQELNAVRGDISDMRGFMRQHIDNQDGLLKELAITLNDRQTDRLEPVSPVAPVAAVAAVEETATAGQHPPVTPLQTRDIAEMQAALMALGFDTGLQTPDGVLNIKTREAAQQFRHYYLPRGDHAGEADGGDIDEALIRQILKADARVRPDVARFGLDPAVLAALRLGSIRSGVDHAFLMEMARAESNFNPLAQAANSSAAGLYQFKSAPWLEAISAAGDNYGLQHYSEALAATTRAEQTTQAITHDPVQVDVLALRLNPRLATLLATDEIKHNLRALSGDPGLDPGRAELYLAHLIGPTATARLLAALQETPDALAAEAFTEAAAQNPVLFYSRGHRPRTLAQLHHWLERKFNTGRYDDPG